MAIYTYEDSFIVDSIDIATLDDKEAKAIIEVGKLNITDTFYIEKLVVAKVYITLALAQLENEGMEAKYRGYSKEFNNYLSLAKTNSSPSNLSTMPIRRG